MYTALRNIFDPQKMPDEAAAEKVSKIRIIHVYGQLGRLPDSSGKPSVPYGVDGSTPAWKSYVKEAAKSIDIIPEVREGSPAFEKAHELLKQAAQIYFLGFGFDPINVRRLLPEDLLETTSTKMYGTISGLDLPELQFLANYGIKGALDSRGACISKSPPAYTFCDQNICDWLKENVHALFT